MGPKPRASTPPRTICNMATPMIVEEGTRMLPVPRAMDAKILKNQTIVAPAKNAPEYSSASGRTAASPPSIV